MPALTILAVNTFFVLGLVTRMESPMADVLPAGFDVEPAHEPVPFMDLVAQYGEIKEDVQEAVNRVLSEQRFILGDEVAEFECDVAEYCDSRN